MCKKSHFPENEIMRVVNENGIHFFILLKVSYFWFLS